MDVIVYHIRILMSRDIRNSFQITNDLFSKRIRILLWGNGEEVNFTLWWAVNGYPNFSGRGYVRETITHAVVGV